MEEVKVSEEGTTGEEVTPEVDKPPEPREEAPEVREEALTDSEDRTMRLRARLTKAYYDALTKEGFTDDQCLSIIGGRCNSPSNVPVPKDKTEE